MITLKLFKDTDISGYTLIEGLPGPGLVGPMANSYMIQKLGMSYIGYIDSNYFPPIAAVHDKMPMYPVRLYKDDKFKLILLIAEFTIPITAMQELSDELLNFIRKNKISQVISIGGMPSPKAEEKAYAISSDPQIRKKISAAGIDLIADGVVAGVSAIMLLKAQQFNVAITDLLVPVNPQIMDPKYAETAIVNLKKLVDISINTDELEAESKELQSRVREMLKKAKSSHEQLDNTDNAVEEDTGPSMYA